MRLSLVLSLVLISACSSVSYEERLWAKAQASGEESDYDRYYQYVGRKEYLRRLNKIIDNCTNNGGHWLKSYPHTPPEGRCTRRW
jgi:hypothetical protein